MRSVHRFRLSSAIFAALLVAAVAAQAAVVSITQARSLPTGTVVTVEGLVSTPPGAFESSFFDKGFGLEGPAAGIFISLQTTLPLHVGQRVRVTGAIGDASGLKVIAPASPAGVIKVRGDGTVRPLWFTTHTIGESTEGLIVRVVGRITQGPSNDLPYGYKFSVDDGSGEVQIFVNTQTGIDVAALATGQLVEVAGFSSQFETHYEIDPRSPADIVHPIR
jgi:hypothetical protein